MKDHFVVTRKVLEYLKKLVVTRKIRINVNNPWEGDIFVVTRRIRIDVKDPWGGDRFVVTRRIHINVNEKDLY